MKEADVRIPQPVLDEIISRLSIVDVIGRYVPLKKSGANFMGLCPFHNERTPSFSVSPAKQIYHCFGCGAGGNLFRFLMEIEHLSFPEAARKLAKEAGVTIPARTRTPEEQKAWAQKQRFFRWNHLAAVFYTRHLSSQEGEPYRSYLKKRGIHQATVDAFGIGSCSTKWDTLFRFLTAQGAEPEELVQLGLVSKSNKGTGYYDRFRGRLMFPIRNASGHTIGFGGRIIDEQAAPQKYLNSPETPLFHKSQVVYGLDMAKQAMRKYDRVLIVEGYMDVLSAHQAGIDYAVAPMGTALTPEQVKQLLRYTYRFTTAFDGDEAGQRATLKSLDLIETYGGRPGVVAFSAESDPDAYIRMHGREAFAHLLAQPMEGLDFRLHVALQDQPTESIEDKMTVLTELLPYLTQVRTQAKLEHSTQKVAEVLNLSNQAVLDELIHYKRQGNRKKTTVQPTQSDDDRQDPHRRKAIPKTQAFKRESVLMNLLFTNPVDFEQVEARGGASLFVSPVAPLYRVCAHHYQRHQTVRSGDVPAEWTPLLAQVLSEAEENEAKEAQDALFHKVLNQMEWHLVNRRYQEKLDLLSTLEQTEPNVLEQALLEMGDLLKEKTRLERDMRKEQ